MEIDLISGNFMHCLVFATWLFLLLDVLLSSCYLAVIRLIIGPGLG